MANGTASPFSNRLPPMHAVGEQMESEFGLMTLNTVRPLDLITFAEGGRNGIRIWVDSAIMIDDENPSHGRAIARSQMQIGDGCV